MPPHDPRDIRQGWTIPGRGYCDQPYIVKTTDGAWLCTMTTGGGREGQHGQHIVALRSTDCGRTWSDPVAIEPADGPEASWALPLVTPAGRLYVFYTYNAQNQREVIVDPGYESAAHRVDTLGEYAFKYSDDGGRTWSAQRWHIPVRAFDIDRRNPYGGAVRFFWGVGKPIVHAGVMYLGFAKVGRFGEGFMAESEGCFLRSDNILTETDPDRIHWVTLPEGGVGLRSPGDGAICDEANLTAFSDGTLFATCRTVEGHPLQAYSRDGGRTWQSEYMRYCPDGPLVEHPRAANFVRRLEQGPHAGRFLYWFHNHCGRTYEHRNPAWLLGGVERDGHIHWGLPEVVLYDPEPTSHISYPDFIEEGNRLFISETQKTVARVHEIDPVLLDRLFAHA